MVEITKVDPAKIEELSFKIIEKEAGEHGLKAGEWAVVRRLIHTTADFEFLQNTSFHPQAVAAGIAAIRSGAAIFTDTRMAHRQELPGGTWLSLVARFTAISMTPR
jgi:precorrin-8X/cobalt-precorrin-8 methylmutase